MKKIISYLFIFVFVFVLFIIKTNAKEVNVYMFYGETCPHCKKAYKYLSSIKDEYNLNIYRFEVTKSNNNIDLLNEVAAEIDVNASSIPYVVINNEAIIGYSQGTTDSTYLYHIKKASKDDFKDRILTIINHDNTTNTIVSSTTTRTTKKKNKNMIIKAPIIGKINLKKLSLPVISILIGLVDGFNPCAMWILLFLISTLISMKDKKRLWILGVTFLVSSSLVYMLFMISWLSFAKMISGFNFLRFLISLVAIIGGIININSFLKQKNNPNGCNVVDDKKRSKIFTKVKKFTHEKSFIIAIFGIILLAASVNVIELACSAGLPVVFTQILSMNDLSTFEYIIYILIYILFFMLDDFIVFAIAVKTFELTGISNKYSKYSHLIGGILMLLIGILLIYKPQWLMFNF